MIFQIKIKQNYYIIKNLNVRKFNIKIKILVTDFSHPYYKIQHFNDIKYYINLFLKSSTEQDKKINVHIIGDFKYKYKFKNLIIL